MDDAEVDQQSVSTNGQQLLHYDDGSNVPRISSPNRSP
jgi:hypothetical protein